MKLLYVIGLLLSVTLLSGCEKGLDASEGNQGASGVGITTEAKQGALTVAEAQEAASGNQVCVKGFIVAATTKSMSNAEFSAPFTGATALVIASKKSDGTSDQFAEEELFPVSLSDAGKGIKDAYNLASNPQYHNQYVYINGTRETYMYLPGLKKVKAIEIDPNHVVTKDEEPVAVDDGNNGDPEDNDGDNGDDKGDDEGDEGDKGSGEGSGSGGEGSDEGEGSSQPSTKVLTVAQAKQIGSQITNVTVHGYIVAATSYSMADAHYQEPFDTYYNNYIVLADTPYDNTKLPQEQYDTQDFTDLFPIYLGDKKKALWKALNLHDNPQKHNMHIQITGTIAFLIGAKGMNEVSDYKLQNGQSY